LTATLLGCQASVPQEPAVQTDAPKSLPEGNATPAFTPTLPQEDPEMTPVTPQDEASGKMVSLVKGHLAQRLNIDVDQIVVSDIKPVVWRDAGLGCPKPGVDYIQVETPGYNILLSAGGKTYSYHTDATKRFVQCNQ
ncbi:MAG TPA: hypothetical protein VJQ26_01035, partial [Ktedonobacteraceae bacterium]|nr:hypothetical protein [Ktedonobacteraceae bacterium]